MFSFMNYFYFCTHFGIIIRVLITKKILDSFSFSYFRIYHLICALSLPYFID